MQLEKGEKMKIRKMTETDRSKVLPMVESFYNSSAVSHTVPLEILAHTFTDAVSENPILEGYVMEEEDKTLSGFAYVTEFYACEVGGTTVMLEEIYIGEPYRGKGYGTEFFRFIREKYAHAARFRLEVTAENEAASKLYQRWGFDYLSYLQMYMDI